MKAIRRPDNLKLTWKELVLDERSARGTASVNASLARISLHCALSQSPRLVDDYPT
jgi:hypothetical protein